MSTEGSGATRGGGTDFHARVAVRVREDRGPGWLELSGLPDETAFGHTLSPPERQKRPSGGAD